LRIALDEMFTMSNMDIILLQKYLNSLVGRVLQRYLMRMFGSAWNRLLSCARLWPWLMRYPRRQRGISWRDLLNAWWWNSETFTNSLQLPIKPIRCGQSVGGGRDSATTHTAVHKICSKANVVFHSLNLTNK
jgi:hypothetical protein